MRAHAPTAEDVEALRAPLDLILARIAARLDGAGIPWALTGSAALAVRGATVEPGDIDIRLAAHDAWRAQQVLGGEVLDEVSDSHPGDRAWSVRGSCRVLGWTIEVLGGMHVRTGPDAPWRPAPGDPARATRRRAGLEVHVPLLDLPEEAAVYHLLGRPERVAQVEAVARRAA